jgi:hypothetical protein
MKLPENDPNFGLDKCLTTLGYLNNIPLNTQELKDAVKSLEKRIAAIITNITKE